MGSLQRILVTGGSGFVGSHLAEHLLGEGYSVRIFDNRPYPYDTFGGRMEITLGDLQSTADIERAIEGCAGIVHLAAVSRVGSCHDNPRRCMATNVMGTVNLLEAMRLAPRVPWMIMGSTREVTSSPDENTTFAHMYGLSKFAAEMAAKRYAIDYSLNVLTLRFADIYGSEREEGEKVLKIFVKRALAGEPLIVSRPNLLFDFIHYEDVVRGILRNMDQMTELHASSAGYYQTRPLGTGRTIRLLELAELIVGSLNSSSRILLPDGSHHIASGNTRRKRPKANQGGGGQALIELEEGIKGLGILLDKI